MANAVLETANRTATDRYLSVCSSKLTVFDNISVSKPSEYRVQAWQMLDNELVAMHHAMCIVRSRQNDLVPISVLPAEILADIFLRLATTCRSQFPYSGHWIGATLHVCHRWRTIALQTANLWTCIHFVFGIDWALDMLKHSLAAPLQVILHTQPTELSTCLDYIRNHFFRIKDLSLRVDARDPDNVLDALSSPGLMLEKVSINCSSRSDIPLPRKMFAGVTPVLRRVNLNACSFLWSCSLFNGLTHLDVNASYRYRRGEPFGEPSFPIDGTPTTALDEFVDSLERMPQLETLRLENCLPYPPPATVTAEQKPVVQLPKLRTLLLSGPVSNCAAVLEHIEANGLHDVYITCTIVKEEAQLRQRLLPVLAAHTSSMHTRTPFRIFQLSPSCICLSEAKGGSKHRLLLRFDEPMDSAMQDVCRALPFTHLEQIFITAALPFGWSPQVWLELFETSDQVRELFLETPEADFICKALIPTASTPTIKATFPNLVALRLKGPHHYWLTEYHSSAIIPLEDYYVWLYKFLQARMEAGMPIESLQVSEAYLELPDPTWKRKMKVSVTGECRIETTIRAS
ncbi:hypothetical protein DENSPDRAFT_836779 [Dentipellis sp. KUC8613]|nr:hypothetical protein DENSPDRAFT_836779 [Dentipellis sp. KUC8613]